MTSIWRLEEDGLWHSPGRTSLDPTFSLGFVEPTALNTGIAAKGLTTNDLTVVNGDLTISNAYIAGGGSLDRLWVKGHVVFTATTDQVVTNSLIEGRTFTPTSPPYEALIHARNTASSAKLSFQYCKITCVQPDVNLSTASGERLGSFYRCDISLGSDALDYWNNTPDVRGCYFHDYSFWTNDSKHTNDATHPGWSHNDFVQCSGSTGGRIIGNSFNVFASTSVGNYTTLTTNGYPNRNYGSAIAMTTTDNFHTDMRIQQNWFRGSEVDIFYSDSANAHNTGNSWDVSGNRFDLNQHGYGSGPYSKQLVRWVYTLGPQLTDVHDNVWLDDVSVTSRGLTPGTSIGAGRFSAGSSQYLFDYSSATQ